jgi:hypothetical protein
MKRRHGILGWNMEGLTSRRVFSHWDSRLARATEAWNLARAGTPVLFSLGPPEIAGTWGKVAAGVYDADLATFVRYLPPCKFTFHHEPENDPIAGSPAEFRAAFDHVAGFLPPWMRPTVVLMVGTFHAGRGDDWVPATARTLAVDAYNWYPDAPWRWPGELMGPVLAYQDALPVAVWETNSREDATDPARKAEWIRQWGALAASAGLTHLTFYDGGAERFSLESSPQAAAAVGELAAADYFR